MANHRMFDVQRCKPPRKEVAWPSNSEYGFVDETWRSASDWFALWAMLFGKNVEPKSARKSRSGPNTEPAERTEF